MVKKPVSNITIKLSPIELRLLTTLAADQLFRREFIDPRLPGFRSNPAELTLGKTLVERLKTIADRIAKAPLPPKRARVAV
jgi:hypothetical protein